MDQIRGAAKAAPVCERGNEAGMIPLGDFALRRRLSENKRMNADVSCKVRHPKRGAWTGQWALGATHGPQRLISRLTRGGVMAVGLIALTACSVPKLIRAPIDLIFPESGDIFSPETKSISASGAEILNAKSEAGEFRGLVTADEPRAADAAAQVLRIGGSAADAATALYFALTVTYPSAAGLGAQGQCLVRAAGGGDVVQFDFTAKASSGIMVAPGAVRGFGLIHNRFGRLSWAQVVQPGEILARTGFLIGRASARSIAAGGTGLLADPLSRAVFGRFDGTLRGEAETVVQPELASTLEQVRLKGAASFVRGPLVDAMAEAGLSDPAGLSLGVQPARLAGTAVYRAESGSAAVSDLSATSFVVIGRFGDAAACNLSMGQAFGTKRMAGRLGFAFATPNQTKMTAIIAGDDRLRFAGAASGVQAANALANALANAAQPNAMAQALAANGASGAEPAHAISCPAGLPNGDGACSAEADPKGAGVARVALRLP
jgi:gamma-glutamyltranspeptidase/glutathione hydrolase